MMMMMVVMMMKNGNTDALQLEAARFPVIFFLTVLHNVSSSLSLLHFGPL